MSTKICTACGYENFVEGGFIIAPRAFALFRQFLTDEERCSGICLTDSSYAWHLVLPAFEVRVSPFALATVARIFDYNETIIDLVEKAQFGGFCLTVRPLTDGSAHLSLSTTTDVQFLSHLDAKPSIIASVAATFVARQRHRLRCPQSRGQSL